MAVMLALAAGAWFVLPPGGRADYLGRYRKELRVGFANEPPYSFSDNGEVTGEAPVVLKHAAEKLGLVNIRWVLMSFNSLIDELVAGHIDVIAAGMFVTPDRAARIRFSIPTAMVGQGLLVHEGNPYGLHSYEDAVARQGVQVAVLDGAVEQGYLRALGMAESRIFACQDVETALSALRYQRVAALALSSPSVGYLAVKSGGTLEAAFPFADPVIGGEKTVGTCALGFRKTDTALAEAFDRALKDFIGSPEHLELLAPLGYGPANVPSLRD